MRTILIFVASFGAAPWLRFGNRVRFGGAAGFGRRGGASLAAPSAELRRTREPWLRSAGHAGFVSGDAARFRSSSGCPGVEGGEPPGALATGPCRSDSEESPRSFGFVRKRRDLASVGASRLGSVGAGGPAGGPALAIAIFGAIETIPISFNFVGPSCNQGAGKRETSIIYYRGEDRNRSPRIRTGPPEAVREGCKALHQGGRSRLVCRCNPAGLTPRSGRSRRLATGSRRSPDRLVQHGMTDE